MKPQLKTLTWSDFEKSRILQEMYGYFSGSILDILNHPKIPNKDKIWAFTREGIMDDKTLRLFAVRCARQVQHLMKDQRSIQALDVSERYANGLATDEELAKAWEVAGEAAREAARGARDAAWVAARNAAEEAATWAAWEVAWVAWVAARNAARAAALEGTEEADEAWEAANKAQVQIAIELIKEFYEEPKPQNKFIKLHGLIKKLITFVKLINPLKLWQKK